MNRLGLVSLVLPSAAAAVLGMTLVAPTGASEDAFPIMSADNFKCLQPVNGSLDNQGAAIVQERCDNSDAQDWVTISLGGTHIQYKNLRSQLCLDARGGATNGTPVQQWTCNSISNEKWDIGEDIPDHPYTLVSLVSGTHSYCLDDPFQSTANGTTMQIFKCNGTAAQSWF
jgi:hypothetical protein